MEKRSWLVSSALLLLAAAIASCWDLQTVEGAQSTASDSLWSCLSRRGVTNVTSASSNAGAYSALLASSLQNLRFTEAGIRRPEALVFPYRDQQVQAALQCTLKAGYEVRVRSGGHSYEGLSSRGDGDRPFVLIDLANMNDVAVDEGFETAWAGAGATLGEIYYHVARASGGTRGFPAGVCPTVGSGGHISGGGYGFLSRKYGTAADNVLDARLVDARGRLLDRATMGEDVFWALRGGGGGSWGIVVAWRLRLVPVPPRVTTYRVWKTGKAAISDLVYRWQSVAPAAPEELFHSFYVGGVPPTNTSSSADIGASFYGQYLGTLSETVEIMGRTYPELGLEAKDYIEGAWIDSAVNIAYIGSVDDLLSKVNKEKGYFKAKSDYVRKGRPLPKEAILGAFDRLQANPGKGYMIFEPYGGIMDRIAEDAIAFPHRKGTLYNIQYQAVWSEGGSPSVDAPLIAWLRGLYAYMQPFVSASPRAAYINYIDLDLGVAPAFSQAQASWGPLYFLHNFHRLSQIKAQIDPHNIFTHPQSVPPLS